MKSGGIHIVSSQEPIIWRQLTQVALCGEAIEKAVAANIVPDVLLCSVGMVASTFGRLMCKDCQLAEEPENGWVYFCLTSEDARKLKRQQELAEVG